MGIYYQGKKIGGAYYHAEKVDIYFINKKVLGKTPPNIINEWELSTQWYIDPNNFNNESFPISSLPQSTPKGMAIIFDQPVSNVWGNKMKAVKLPNGQQGLWWPKDYEEATTFGFDVGSITGIMCIPMLMNGGYIQVRGEQGSPGGTLNITAVCSLE